MTRSAKVRVKDPGFEPLEGRALLSSAGIRPPRAGGAALLAPIAQVKTSNPSIGETYIHDALNGGAGHEFVTLARKEVPNPLGVALGFLTGNITQFNAPGLAFRNATLQSEYTLSPHDPLMIGGGGAIELKGPVIELAALVRGPFTTYPRTTYIVFGINRGAGEMLGPIYPALPGITPDALVTVKVGPDGKDNSATVTDLTTGVSTPLVPPAIKVAGPTVRILVNPSQLPSKGFSLSQYTFTVWAEPELGGGISTVGSFAPDSSMMRIGLLTNVNPPTL